MYEFHHVIVAAKILNLLLFIRLISHILLGLGYRMSHGQDEVLTCLATKELDVQNHPPHEPTSFTGIREEDGDSRDSGIVPDYQSPVKMLDTQRKATVRKGLTDKTNTDVQTQELPMRATKPSIEESPVSSRRPQRLLTQAVISFDDISTENVPSVSTFEETDFVSMHASSSTSISSFSCAETDIVWTPEKPQIPGRRSVSEDRTARVVKIRKRITDSVLSDSGVQRKRSCAIRTELFQSDTNTTQDEVFEADDFSPNASYANEASSRASSRSFTRTQSAGQLEMGESQQGSPNFGPAVEYSLPGVEHPQRESLAFRSISAETLASEIRRLGPDEFERRYLLIDCRYPYEYEGGHVKCAINLHDQNELENLFFPDDPNHPIRSRIPIFYCEFSQKRGPGMALALRSIDRMRNELNYPKVDYAEMYLLDHGYRKFWNDGCYKSECVPCGYVPMTDSAHVSSLIKYKWHKSKSTSQLIVREPLRKVSLYRHRSLMQVCTEVETTAEVVISPTAKTPLLAPRRLEFTDSPEWGNAE
nr:Rhodanese domain containing protein [Haemonchus contortus]